MTEGGLRTRGVMKSSAPTKPLLSIITVVLNGAFHVERAIDSVLIQNYSNIEYIILDGASSDGTVEIIRRHENNIDYWISEPDNGIYDAMNKGVNLSRGELIGFLNADDYYEPGALIKAVNSYLDAGVKGIYFGNSFILQEDLGVRYLSVGKSSLWRGLGFRHQAMLTHRDVHEKIGNYNAAYRIAADYDFVMHAVSVGVKLVHVNVNLVNYSNMGVSGVNHLKTMSEIRKINKKYYGFLSVPHFGFLALFVRSSIFQVMGSILAYTLGSRSLLAVRAVYTKWKY